MDIESKLKMYCECEIQRARIASGLAFDRYIQTRSALDLADLSQASQVQAITERICNSVLDLMKYHYEVK